MKWWERYGVLEEQVRDLLHCHRDIRAHLELVQPGHDPQTSQGLWEVTRTLGLLEMYQGSPSAWLWGQAWPKEVWKCMMVIDSALWGMPSCFDEMSTPGHFFGDGKWLCGAALFWEYQRDLAKVGTWTGILGQRRHWRESHNK